MKTALKVVTSLFLAAQFCNADVTDKLLGKWSGSGTATSDSSVVTQQITTVYKRYRKTGLVATTTIRSGGIKLIGTSKFRENGRVEGTLKVDGATVAVMSGTWRATKKALYSNIRANGLFPSFHSQSSVSIVSKNRISLSGSASNGERSVASLTKR